MDNSKMILARQARRRIMDTIKAQEDFETMGRARMGAQVRTPAECRHYSTGRHTMLACRDTFLTGLEPHERAMFELWRGAPESTRQAVKAVLTDC